MNKLLFLLPLLVFSVSGHSQELNSSGANNIPAFNEIEFPVPEEVYVGFKDVRPSLSFPVRELTEPRFSLMEINFDKKAEKRQVNLIAMMEQERYEKEKAIVELDAPMPNLSAGEKASIEVTNEFRIHDRSSNFDIYTGKKKIPAYEEMTTPLFRPGYSPFSGRGYISPNVYYNPYLR